MKTRESCLPAGWYPHSSGEIRRFLTNVSQDNSPPNGKARAAIAPHAGWYYSGKIAATAVSALDRTIDTIVVIGGHLPAGYPPLFAMEDSVSTPLGNMEINAPFRAALIRELDGREDRFPDNTVEVLLPMARFYMPNASLLWLRLPAEKSSFDAGRAVAAAADSLGCSAAVLASTDLTHYGPQYGFTPKGTGEEALRWVQDVNDRRFIDAVEAGDPVAVLERAATDCSSCSAGAVLGAMGFACAQTPGLGLSPARLLAYGTSAEADGVLSIPDSFVGYAAFVLYE